MTLLEQFLFKNGFNSNFTCSVINKQLNKLLNPSPRPTTVNKAVIYFTIPYRGNASFKLRNGLTKLLKCFYPQVAVRVIFKPCSTIQNWFNIKDRIPVKLQSSVIYLYQCGECNLRYVGQTGKHLKERISNHLGISSRTQQPLAKPPHSAIRDHSHSNDHPIRRDSFKVLGTFASNMERLTAEALHIHHLKPELNFQDHFSLLCF